MILKIVIPQQRVGKAYQTALAKIAQGVEVPGFRKGKAPENLVREKVDKNKVYEEVVRELIPQVYLEAVKEQGLSPIVNPKVSLVSVKEGEDWQIEAATCEAPKAVLGDYKEKVRKMKGGPKIWIPGQGEGKEKSGEKEALKNQKYLLAHLLRRQKTLDFLLNL